VDIRIEPETVSVRAKLVPITTDVFQEGEFDEVSVLLNTLFVINGGVE
jgi:hypothetical protein